MIKSMTGFSSLTKEGGAATVTVTVAAFPSLVSDANPVIDLIMMAAWG